MGLQRVCDLAVGLSTCGGRSSVGQTRLYYWNNTRSCLQTKLSHTDQCVAVCCSALQCVALRCSLCHLYPPHEASSRVQFYIISLYDYARKTVFFSLSLTLSPSLFFSVGVCVWVFVCVCVCVCVHCVLTASLI